MITPIPDLQCVGDSPDLLERRLVAADHEPPVRAEAEAESLPNRALSDAAPHHPLPHALTVEHERAVGRRRPAVPAAPGDQSSETFSMRAISAAAFSGAAARSGVDEDDGKVAVVAVTALAAAAAPTTTSTPRSARTLSTSSRSGRIAACAAPGFTRVGPVHEQARLLRAPAAGTLSERICLKS